MSFDGLMMYHLCQELAPKIVPSKIEGIFFAKPSQLLLHLYNGQKYMLVLDLNPSGNAFYVKNTVLKSKDMHPFLHVLTKYLKKARITSMHQHQTDRVVIIDIETYDAFEGATSYQLIFEAMGKHANVIFVHDGKILSAMKHIVSLTHRSIAPNIDFTFFPSNKKPFTHMKEVLPSAKDISDTYEGIAPDTARKLILEKKLPLALHVSPTYYQGKKYVYDISEGKKFSSLNALMQYVEDTSTSFTVERELLFKQLKKKQQKIIKLQEDLTFHKEALQLKDSADLLMSVPDLHRKEAHLHGISLDPTQTIIENINDMYKNYKKAKRAIDRIEEQLAHTRNEQALLESLLFDIDAERMTHQELKDVMVSLGLIKKTISTPVKQSNYIRFDGKDFTIFVGKNAVQNNYVTHQLAHPNDYFMHVKDAPGSHVIYRGDETSLGFMLALKVAAYHSKLKLSSSIPVNYTLKKYVKKIAGIFGSHVTLKSYQTKYVDLDDDFVNMWESK